MKKIGEYWVDDNGNKWPCYCINEELAIIYSKSLTNCGYCRDCRDCRNCHECYYCYYCSDCCNCCNCSYCSDCSDCSDCNDCINCDNCSDCSNCSYCNYCRSAKNYKSQPSVYITGKIGSRNDNTIFYYGETENGMSLQVVCGCFRGDLEEFEAAVMKTHAENDVYRNQYLKEIDKAKALFEL